MDFAQIVEKGDEKGEEVLKAVQEITKGNGEKAHIQNSRGTAPYLRGGNSHFKTGWEGLEQPNSRYDLKGRDLSWDYSHANISYEGSYLVATNGSMENLEPILHKPLVKTKHQ